MGEGSSPWGLCQQGPGNGQVYSSATGYERRSLCFRNWFPLYRDSRPTVCLTPPPCFLSTQWEQMQHAYGAHLIWLIWSILMDTQRSKPATVGCVYGCCSHQAPCRRPNHTPAMAVPLHTVRNVTGMCCNELLFKTCAEKMISQPHLRAQKMHKRYIHVGTIIKNKSLWHLNVR